MKAKVKWIGDDLFIGTSQNVHAVALDANGDSLVPSPLENILISLGIVLQLLCSVFNQRLDQPSVIVLLKSAITIQSSLFNRHE